MKVFLSWSGEHSHAVAQAFNEWLPTVLQSLTPWLSSEHIAKGATWLTDVQKALSESNGVGIFFLTQEAMRSEWMLFEAGGIAALEKRRVITVCVDMQPSELKPPLNFFQATKLINRDVWLLVKDLNDHVDKPLPEALLQRSFDRAWPELELAVKEATPKSKGLPVASPTETSSVTIGHTVQLMEGMRRIELRIGAIEEIQNLLLHYALGLQPDIVEPERGRGMLPSLNALSADPSKMGLPDAGEVGKNRGAQKNLLAAMPPSKRSGEAAAREKLAKHPQLNALGLLSSALKGTKAD